ncbi:MAG: DNA-3-methyladenine glycosylase, partial [Planctomycetota bacterium]
TSMFGPPGSIYVYPIHAKHCINVVTQASGTGSAVLIRALQPIWGTSLMKRRRNSHDDRRWTSGPGMICQSLGIDRRHDGIDPEVDPKWCLMPGPATGLVNNISITTTPRIGVSQAKELPLRFFVDGNRYVSGRAADHKRPRRETLKISEAALRRFGFLLS